MIPFSHICEPLSSKIKKTKDILEFISLLKKKRSKEQRKYTFLQGCFICWHESNSVFSMINHSPTYFSQLFSFQRHVLFKMTYEMFFSFISKEIGEYMLLTQSLLLKTFLWNFLVILGEKWSSFHLSPQIT